MHLCYTKTWMCVNEYRSQTYVTQKKLFGYHIPGKLKNAAVSFSGPAKNGYDVIPEFWRAQQLQK